MDIIVCLKQIFDLGQIKIDTTTKHPITEGVARKISDFDKNALEEAVRIKGKHGGNILALIGGHKRGSERSLIYGRGRGYYF